MKFEKSEFQVEHFPSNSSLSGSQSVSWVEIQEKIENFQQRMISAFDFVGILDQRVVNSVRIGFNVFLQVSQK